ncbi:uncharacterized protein [Amphiura filiformis]|uniref:uncharacterized protein n=1 Tax=Amphiura filiformis TaxID=82378 RepID=UPI003B20C96D
MGIVIGDYKFFLVLLVTLITVSHGSHYLGGTIHWYREPMDSTSQYPITIMVRSSWLGTRSEAAECANSNSAVNTVPTESLYCKTGNCNGADSTGKLFQSQSNTCTDYNGLLSYASMEEIFQTSTATLPVGSTYELGSQISSTYCCWASPGESINYLATIDLTSISATNMHSPQVIMIPTVRIKKGCPTLTSVLTLNIPIFDADQNAANPVTCRWANIAECGSLCTYQSSMNLTNGVDTCTISIPSNPSGNALGVAITVEDHANAAAASPVNAVPLQFWIQYYTEACDKGIPTFVAPTPADLTVFTYTSSQAQAGSFSATIRAQSSGTGLLGLTINTVTAPEFVVPQQTAVTGNQNQREITLTLDNAYTYTGTQNAYQACFTAQDQNGASDEVRCITVHINDDPVTCDPNPCNNNGACSINGQGVAECDCVDDWTGSLCQTAGGCNPNPCQNGGTCAHDVNTGARDSCTCTGQWQGDICETAGGCVGTPCLNGGECMFDADGNFAGCTCTAQWSGGDCSTPLGCADIDCQNGGTCIADSDGNFDSCDCTADFVGEFCATGIGCDPDPCDQGSCEFDVADGSFMRCDCLEGWTGTYCTIAPGCNTDPCVMGSCVTNADGTLFGRCDCQSGFSGQFCDIDDDCDSCNQGVCIVDTDGAIVSCSCNTGWSGQFCDVAQGCADINCQNGGQCVAKNNGNFDYCDCTADRAGSLCEIGIGCFPNPCIQGTCQFDAADGSFVQCNDCVEGWTGTLCDIGPGCNNPDPCVNGNCVTKEDGTFGGCVCHSGFSGQFCDQDVICPGDDGFDVLHECVEAGCDWGCFESINYPEPYTSEHSALYLISVTSTATSITFKCDSPFKIEENKDVLFAGEGSEPPFPLDSTTPNVNMFDGCDPPSFTITGSMAWLYFRTDKSKNEMGWRCCWHADDPCADNPCNNGGTCVTNADGTYSCDCTDGWTGDNCETVQFCCRAYGDPHYVTFDGKYYDFQGTCQYLLVGGAYQGVPFQVIQQNVPWGSTNRQVSVTEEIIINIGDFQVILKQDLVCCVIDTINGVTYVFDPCTMINGFTGFSVYSNAPNTCVYLKTDFGLTVKWDGRYNVDVWIVGEFSDLVEGLCGNMNGNPDDDCMNPAGDQLNNPVVFGNSWAQNPDECTPVDPSACDYYPCDEIDEELVDYADELCSILSDKWGPFAACHEVINPEPYECSCRYDLCATLPDLGTYCDTVALYTALCRRAGIRIRPWRNDWLCPYTCPVGSHYEFCTTECPQTCVDVAAGEPPKPCGDVCVEGCECDEGLVADGGRCISQDKCGCIDGNGNYRRDGEIWIDGTSCIGNNFIRRCECSAVDQITCTNMECSSSATCGLMDGIFGCHCNEGLIGDGLTCTDNPCLPNPCGDLGTCVLDSTVANGYYCVCKRGATVNADGHCDTALSYCTFQAAYHYMTFGGSRYDYQSGCQHVLVRSCSSDNYIVVYDGADSGQVSAIFALYIYIFDATKPLICIRRRKKRFSIEVNGSEVLPPVVGIKGVTVTLIGDSMVVTTDFGLEVKWSGHSNIEIALPTSDLSGACGMCREESVTDANEVGKNHLFGQCTLLTYDATYNPCGEVNPLIQTQAEALCAILIDADGPFGNCHSTINPDPVYARCLFQMCATNLDRWTLCSIIAFYALQCQECNIKIGRWRDRKFCPLECPPGSRYNHCIPSCPERCDNQGNTDPCPERCDNQGNTDPCPRPCIEGCECIDEFPVWGAYQCVPRNRCGCVVEGIYVDPGTTYIKPECKQSCTCHPDGTEWCNDIACSADASCVTVDSFFDIFYECRCDTDGLSGDGLTCNDDPCMPTNPCQNGGTCYRKDDGGYGCICYRGYDGPNCDEDRAYCGVAANNYYATFDGFFYNYFGGCCYILVQNCRGSNPDFHVVQCLDSTQWKPSTKAIILIVYEKRIEILNNKYVTVNGQYVNLPYDCGQVQITLIGGYVVITTDFGLIVRYNGLYTAEISVPGSYKDQVCGICGNYDGNAEDANEISGLDKKGFPTAALFFAAFQSDIYKPYDKQPCYEIDFPTYVGGYLDETAELVDFAAAKEACSLLIDDTGPFASCFPYHPKDIFYLVCYQFTGLCALDGNADRARCAALDIYAQRCQGTQNVELQPWRELAGCDLCPENSEYTSSWYSLPSNL